MKSRVLIYALLVLNACTITDNAQHDNRLEGIWLLSKYSGFKNAFNYPMDIWWHPKAIPIGFRFYTRDSAEVYRTNHYGKQERFVPYKINRDSLSIFQSDSLGWWKRKIMVSKDSMVIYSNADTILYKHLHLSKPNPKRAIKRIALTAGSSWGWIISAVMYPNGKTLVSLKSRNMNAPDRFFIKNTPLPFSRLSESYYYAKQVEACDEYSDLLRTFGGTLSDGDFSEMLLLDRDSAWYDHHGQMYSYQNLLLGLQGYAILKIFPEWTNKNWDRMPTTMGADSVRKMIFPICRLESISNRHVVLTLLSESLNSMNEMRDSYPGTLSLYFSTRGCLKKERTFYTNGKIVRLDSGYSHYGYYNLGLDFIDLIKNQAQ